MSVSHRLSEEALASGLSKLPTFTSSSPSQLDPVRIALAMAIASGQSADEIANDFRVPAAWRGIDLSKPPEFARAKAAPTPAAGTAPLAESRLLSPVPEWAARIIPHALARNVTTRVAILDREPTALGGLELPVWARALKPAATYGPFTASGMAQGISTTHWVHVFHFTETVEFVRAGTVLCVLPLSSFHLGSSHQSAILSGSAWIGLTPFNATAPPDSFAGISIQSGELTCDHPLTLGPATVNIPAGATFSLALVPAPSPAGPLQFPSTITAPGKISVLFPPSGAATIWFDSCSAVLYGANIACATAKLPAVYNSALKMLYVQGHSSSTTFAPVTGGGGILEIHGSAPVINAGWVLSVSESTTPLSLGTAVNSGDFGILFGSGITITWSGLPKPEPAAGGALVAQNGAILLAALSGSARGAVIEQVFDLWPDQDSAGKQPCKLVSARGAGQGLLYARAVSNEIIELGAELVALIDRPLYATGARPPAFFLEAIIALIHSHSGNRFIAYSALAAPNRTVFPMALDNAFLDVSVPLAILVSAKTDASFNALSGGLLLLMGYLLVELYLPDPYTGGFIGLRSGDSRSGLDAFSPIPGGGFLFAEVLWSVASGTSLRLADAAHAHPALPPSSEAGDAPSVPNAQSQIQVLPFPINEETTARLDMPPAQSTEQPPSTAFPKALNGAVLLDLSTRASQLGVEVTMSSEYDPYYSIDGLSVRGPAGLLPLTTLPAIAWEPMYDHADATPGVNPYQLAHPPDDGPLPQVRALSATLIPISPLQSLQSLLNAGPGAFLANFTLPFGMTAQLNSTVKGSTLLPNLTLVQPSFAATATPTGSLYTGAWQLSFSAPNPSQADPVLAGRTYLRSQGDNPPSPTFSYGEQVLGPDVAYTFGSRFNAPGGGVPLLRYDLTGYGASTFSEWTNTNPAPTDVIKSFFHVITGRTGHEVIEIQSLICPFAPKAVRTVTIDRQSSGAVRRYDSGWQPASDGLFQYPDVTGITPDQIHSGVIAGVINITNIKEVGLPIFTTGTKDGTGFGGVPPDQKTIPVQPVTFDADVIIQPQHQVLKGGATAADLKGNMHVCVPAKGISGYIPLEYQYHLSIQDMAGLPALAAGAGAPFDATLNVAGANSIVRITSFDATPLVDAASGGAFGIIGAVHGLPKLSSDGAWTVAARKQSEDAPASLPANESVPLVQPNTSGGTTPGALVHFADPSDIFRLDPSSATPPDTLYGFLQGTGTQSNFLSRPILTVGSQNLTLGDALNVAHAGALLGAISSFPGINSCLNFLNSELDPIQNQLGNATLTTTQSLQLSTMVRKTPITLIPTSIADVDLYFYWSGDDPSVPPDPATVVIALGQPTSPSWSLDINRVAFGLVVPALDRDPIIWLQGGFHADADSTPAFPDLKVVFDGPLQPLTQFFTVLQDIASVLSPGSSGMSAKSAGGGSGAGLDVHFSDGKLTVTDNFAIPAIPLGPGTIDHVSLDIGAGLDILGLTIDFLVSIGTPDTPCHWIVDPLAGTICIQAGVQKNHLDILIQGGIGLGLAIDLGIASGSASITIAVQIEIDGTVITLMLLLTGQAQVDVLGGLASAAITLTAGLGFSIDLSNADIDLIGTASVGIHISICWFIDISWDGSWTFEKQLPLTQIA